MANRRLNATALAKRRHDVAKMNRAGMTLAEIGEILDVDAATVCRDLEWVRQEWLKQKFEDFDRARAIELAKLNLVERYLWDAFERSKEYTVTRIQARGSAPGNSDGGSEGPNRASPR